MVVRWAPPICIIKVQLVFVHSEVKAKHVSFTSNPKYGFTLQLLSLRKSIAHCEYAKWLVTQVLNAILGTFKERFGELRINPSGTHTAFTAAIAGEARG